MGPTITSLLVPVNFYLLLLSYLRPIQNDTSDTNLKLRCLRFTFENLSVLDSSGDMLSAKELLESKEKSPGELPSFGKKEFEPDESLEESRQIEESILQIKSIISHERVKLLNSLSQAVWHQEFQLAEVTHQTGSHWAYMGHRIGEKLYIHPEEALYLLETGCIQIMYNEVPLSVQRLYFIIFNGGNSITIEKYRVYSHISNYGYKVLRHSPLNSVTKYEKKIEVHKIGLKLKDHQTFGQTEKRQQDFNDGFHENTKKLKVEELKMLPIICEKEDDDKEILKQIPRIQPYIESTATNLNFDYDVYSETFKKSCLQLPNFRIIVHRGEDSTPDVKELCKLSNKYKDEIPVIHAVVLCDCIAFYKIDPVILPDAQD